MADLLSYGDDEIRRLFPKCRVQSLPAAGPQRDVNANRDLIDLTEPAHLPACGWSAQDWNGNRDAMDEVRRVSSEPPADDSDSSSGRPCARDSRIELAGGRELFCQSRSRPGKRRPQPGGRGDRLLPAEPPPTAAEATNSLHLAILGFQPMRETALVGSVGMDGDVVSVGETPVDGRVMFDDIGGAPVEPPQANGRLAGPSEDCVGGGERPPHDPDQRVIGSVPIAEYEGSPRRYGPKPAAARPGHRPGFPQRVWQETGAAPEQEPAGHWPDRQVVEQAEPGLQRRHYFWPAEVRELTQSAPAEPDRPGAVTAPTAAASPFCQPPDGPTAARTDSCERPSLPAELAGCGVEPALATYLSLDKMAAPTGPGGAAPRGAASAERAPAPPELSRNFTLSPDTTECDSGEVESELSEGSLPSSGRLGAAMPVLEDGLSDGGQTDSEPEEELPPAPLDPTAALIRHHLGQLEAERRQQQPPPPTPPSPPPPPPPADLLANITPTGQSEIETCQQQEQQQTQHPHQQLQQQRLQQQQLQQQQQQQPHQQPQQPRVRYGNGDVDLRSLDPLGSAGSSPPPPPPPPPAAGSTSPSAGQLAGRSPSPPGGHQMADRRASLTGVRPPSAASPGLGRPESVQAAIQDIRQAIRRTRALPVRSSPPEEGSARLERPVWIPRRSGYQKLSTHCDDPPAGVRHETEEADTDQETDRLLGQQRSVAADADAPDKERDAVKKKGKSKEVYIHEPAVLIEGVLFRARYLGSTQLVCEGQPTKATRMMQAEEAVSRIKAANDETRSLPSMSPSSPGQRPVPGSLSCDMSASSLSWQLSDELAGGRRRLVPPPTGSAARSTPVTPATPPSPAPEFSSCRPPPSPPLSVRASPAGDASCRPGSPLYQELALDRTASPAATGSLFHLRYLGALELEERPGDRRRRRPKTDMVQEAVAKIRVPDGETQPSTDVDLFISTEKIMVLNTDLKEIMMDHALRTISYIADIGELVVLMARRRVTADISGDLPTLPKMICHVFESDEAQFIAQSIGQAFQVAYMEFLKANGIEDHSFVKEMDYQEVLNSQEIFGEELKMFAKKELQKEVVVPKQKGEILGVVIVESGWGSLVPTVVIANLAPAGAAARCGLLNIGDQIIAINGISLVGLPLASCQAYVKNAKQATVVKLTVVPCPPVVEVRIRRPDTKYQLGFSVQNGVICSLLRGGIAERGGVRVGHRIIEINSQSVVAVPHDRIVSLLATSVGEIHMKTMPTSLFRLLTGQESPVYI